MRRCVDCQKMFAITTLNKNDGQRDFRCYRKYITEKDDIYDHQVNSDGENDFWKILDETYSDANTRKLQDINKMS